METKHRVEASQIVICCLRLHAGAAFGRPPPHPRCATGRRASRSCAPAPSFTTATRFGASRRCRFSPPSWRRCWIRRSSRTRPRSEIEAAPTGRKFVLAAAQAFRALFAALRGARPVHRRGPQRAARLFPRPGGQIRDDRLRDARIGRGFAQRRGAALRGRRAWFKNEGLGYQVAALGGVWGVAIDPFYIFTGSDAKKPLPSLAQIERSNRWNGRDAKTGSGHLTFWEDFLTLGAASRRSSTRQRG